MICGRHFCAQHGNVEDSVCRLCRSTYRAKLQAEAAQQVEVERREEAFLAELLANVCVLNVRAPFPTDPHRVAHAIARWL